MLKETWRKEIASWRYLSLQEIGLEWWKKYEVCSRVWWRNAVAWLVRHIWNETFIIIDQYRYPLQKRVLELVAWVVDKDLAEENIMKEEVIEETWYEDIWNIEYLVETSASAWALSETTKLYDVEVDWNKWPQSLWEMEDINVYEIPYVDFRKFLNSKIKEWLIIDPKVCMAIFMTMQKTWNIII